jgi:tetratricopeptide (TPR) repeat protein
MTPVERQTQLNRLLDAAYDLLDKTERAQNVAGDPLERARLSNHVVQIKDDIKLLEARLADPADNSPVPSAYPFVGGQSFAGYENLLKDISGLLKLSAARAEDVRIYAPGGLPEIDLDSVVGRENDLAELHTAVRNNACLSVVAMSGMGKSTLVWLYLTRLSKGNLRSKRGGTAPLVAAETPKAIFWDRINRNDDLTRVLGDFFAEAAPEAAIPPSAWEKQPPGEQIEYFLREIMERPYLIVLDNFEVLIDPNTLQPYNDFFGQLLERLIALTPKCPSRVIITSWDVPKSLRGRSPQVMRLTGLTDRAGAEALAQWGLAHESLRDRQRASRRAGGNPYALRLLADLVQQEEGFLTDYLGDNSLWDNENAGLVGKAYERLTLARQEALIRFDPWRVPVGANELALLEEIIAETDPNIEPRPANYWEALRRDCEQQNVILGQRDEAGKRRVGRLPELMRRYLETQVLKPGQIRDLHRATATFYSRQPVPPREDRHNFESVQPLVEVIWQMVSAGDLDAALTLLFDEGLPDDLFRWGAEGRLIELYERLVADSAVKDLNAKAKLYGYLGLCYWALHNIDRALECHAESLKIARRLKDRQLEGNALGSTGICHQRLNDYYRAIDYHNQHLAIAREVGDKWGEGQALGRLGTCYRSLGDYNKGIEFQEERLPISRATDDRRGEGNALGELGLCYFRLGDETKANQYFFESLVIRLQISDRWGESDSLKSLALVNLELGKTQQGLAYLLDHLAICLELGNPRSILEAQNRVGHAYDDLGDTEKAREYFQAAVDRIKDRDDLLDEVPIVTYLADSYEQLGDFESANRYYEDADRLTDKMRRTRKNTAPGKASV